MILGRSLLQWCLIIIIAICIFLLAKWLVPILFGLVGVAIPGQIVIVIALLITLAWVYGGYNYNYRSAP